MTHAVVEWLLGNATIQDLVGDNNGGDTHKIYQAIVPQDEKPPFVCVRVANFTPIICKGEPSLKENDVIQVDCYAHSYKDAYILYRAIRQTMDGNSFTASDATELYAEISGGRDYAPNELAEISKRNFIGIVSIYNVEVKLGAIT